jgi:hypothetical protein
VTRYRMSCGSLVCFGIGAAFGLAVLLGVAVPGVGHAGMRKCEDHFLDADDDMRLRAAMLRVLPKSVHLDQVGACRNPRSAYAWISTKKGTSIEGVQQWYEFTCSRKAQPWQCDAPELKQLFNMPSVVDGSAHEIELAFDKEIALDRAVNLANAALRVYGNPDAKLPFCNSQVAEESDWIKFRPRLRMPAGKISIQISADDGKTTQTVWLNDVDVALEFDLAQKDGVEVAPSCWGVEIIVA